MGPFPLKTSVKMQSVGVKDVDQQVFTKALAAFLKKSGKVKLPEWVDIVKTNVAKELAPYDEDWYYTRLASMARHIYVRSPVGVSTVCKSTEFVVITEVPHRIGALVPVPLPAKPSRTSNN